MFDEVFGVLEPGYLYVVMVEGDERQNRGRNALKQLDPPRATTTKPPRAARTQPPRAATRTGRGASGGTCREEC